MTIDDLQKKCEEFKSALNNRFAPNNISNFIDHVIINSKVKVSSISNMIPGLESQPDPPEQLICSPHSGRSSVLFEEDNRNSERLSVKELERYWIDEDMLEETDSPHSFLIVKNIKKNLYFNEFSAFVAGINANLNLKMVRFVFYGGMEAVILGFTHLESAEKFHAKSKKKYPNYIAVFGPMYEVRFVRNRAEASPPEPLSETRLIDNLLVDGHQKKKKDL